MGIRTVMSSIKVLAQRVLLAGACFIIPSYSKTSGQQECRIATRSDNICTSKTGLGSLLALLLLAVGSTAQAGEFCSSLPFLGTIDGENPAHVAALDTQITIDRDCTFQNFTASNPLTVTINFHTNDPSIYLITFNNVIFTGHMACANIDHRIWFVNGSDYGSNNNCQDLFVPVEAINKQNPANTTVGIGDPFTYTMSIPVLYDPVTATYLDNFGSANNLHSITITDDLNATGADLTLIGVPTVTWRDSGTPVLHTFTNVGGFLTFTIDPTVIIPAGDQIEIELTVVADNTNAVGTQFVNTAKWEFGRLIDINGIPKFFSPLPGEWGVTDTMTIGGPDLVVTKTSPDTALNLGSLSTFTIDVQNAGGARAWNATIIDNLPDTATAGMCDYDPTATITAQVFEADGVTPVSGVLTPGVDYIVAYNDATPPPTPTCQLSLTMQTAAASIGPSERLIITYQTQLNGDTTADGAILTNVAGATQWFSGDGSYPRTTFNRTLTDGTTAVVDHQDSHTITTALTGYIFQKTVQNVSNGDNPATTASSGDTLRYRVRLFNFTEVINDVTITDILNTAYFDLDSFNMVAPPGAGATYTYNNITGELQIVGSPPPLDLIPPQELVFEFDIDLLPTLTNGTVVSNQASLNANGPPVVSADSDDPYINGIAAPGDPADPTNVTILAPGPMTKTNTQTEVAIGEQLTFRVTVPTTPVNTPLYDVRILDDLTAVSADMSFVSASVVSGGAWSLTNTGSATSIVLEDLGTGIDIPANSQAVIDINVRLGNTMTNQRGVTFNNTASYTYNRSNGNSSTQTPGGTGSSSTVTIVEPHISTITKSVNTTLVNPGDTVRYSVDLTAQSGTHYSDVFDVMLVDSLPLGLVYAGNPTVTAGAGVSADNMIAAPAISGNGTSIPQTLVWGAIEADIDISAGETVTIAYDVQILASAFYNQSYNNSVTAEWTSLDGEPGGERNGGDDIGGLNDYITTSTSVAINTLPEALAKQNLQSTATIGEQFSYRITVPASPQSTALYDVRIQDDLTASAADLSFVSVTKVSGSQPWTPINTGTASNLVIADPVNGIDIPAGEQVVIDVVVQLDDTTTNVVGLLFNNTANYTFNQTDNIPATETNGLAATTGNMTIIGPENLTLEKSGPATIQVGTPGTFSLNVHNISTSPAYDLTIEDMIPNPDPGGMCDSAPNNITAQMYLSDAVTPVGAALVEDTDFTVTFVTGTPECTLTFTMLTPAAAIPVDHRLIISYDLNLDTDSTNNVSLTNIAAATQWFSADTENNIATGAIRTYSRPLTDGTPSTLDHEDAYTVVSETPIIDFQKYVINVTTGQDPGVDAAPGDILRYRLVATNISDLDAPNFTITDELDRLTSSPVFVPGSLNIVSVPVGADISNSDPNGGVNGTGLLDVRGLSITDQNGADPGVTIEFEVTLANVIDSGPTVMNQAHVQIYDMAAQPSDDPNLPGSSDATLTTITSTPDIQLQKISNDLTGLATELLPGDTLRYTLTARNVGDEHAVNTVLQDSIPANTTYVAGSTTLNGSTLTDPAVGVSPLEAGMLINSSDTTTAGLMTADPTATSDNVATITFDVTINPNVIFGTIISNQGYLNADGAGNSGPIPQLLSDDPDTLVLYDPTRDIVGDLPLIDAIKTVALNIDNSTPDVVDPGDTLRYTITIFNYGAVEATGVTLTDAIPVNTTYVANSVYLNGLAVADEMNGDSPLLAGLAVSSSDLTPPLPTAGYLSPGESATITFDVTVDAMVLPGTIISNQGFVANDDTPVELTDADGFDSNGDQPTLIAVGNAQQLSITKSVSVVDGDIAVAGGQLEYVVRVTNIGTVPATDVEMSDDLNPAQMTYVPNSATLNGMTTGVVYLAPSFTVDYGNIYGLLQPGATAEFRFRVLLDAGLSIGDTVTNTAQVHWNAMTQSAMDSASIDIGTIPGMANLNGRVWHDGANFDNRYDPGLGEHPLENWNAEIYFNGNLLGSVATDANGEYHINGLAPNYIDPMNNPYELRFVAAGAGTNTAKLGYASSEFSGVAPPFTDGRQYISSIVVSPGDNLQNLNMPIEPNGVVYNSIVRIPVAGASVRMLDTAGNLLPEDCFDDPIQQNQVTTLGGYYKFDLNFSQLACSPGGDYLIQVTPPASGFVISDATGANESIAIPPLTNAATAPFAVVGCPGGVDDAVPGTANHCEVQTFADTPVLSIPPGSAQTNYHLNLTLDNGLIPGESQLFNNHIPLDPDLGQAVTITKTTPMVNVSRGDLIPYTIKVNNTLPVPLTDLLLIDSFPPGFKYVEGSARLNGVSAEPVLNNLQLIWNIDTIGVEEIYTLELLLVVGSGVQEGEYINRAHIYSELVTGNVSVEASAMVRVVPDPTFDCSDIIGKVFDDRNKDGYQDDNEPGIAGARVVTAQGLLITTDEYGRFHLTCAAVPDEQRGSNFILKVDERSLPSGYRMTTENPRVQRLTRGKMARFNFGATVHHVVTLSLGDDVFETDSTSIRKQWQSRLGILIEELRQQDSVLRITYLADVESAGLVHDRLDKLKTDIETRWHNYSTDDLEIEIEIVWRHGEPVDQNKLLSKEINMTDSLLGVFNKSRFSAATEQQLPHRQKLTQWQQDEDFSKTTDSPEFEIKQVTEKEYTTHKLKNVVPPVLFSSGKAEIPDGYLDKLREVLNGLRNRVNVRLHFIGHTDNMKLSDELKQKYGDNLGLSRERAGTTAEFFQQSLELQPETISYEGMGATNPIASNNTESGRAKNRRVEVEVWYDEVSEKQVERQVQVEQEVKRIKVCRVETLCKLRYKEGHSHRAKLKNLVPPFHYDEGISDIPQKYLKQLQQALDNLSDKGNVQMRFIGFTDNNPLTGRDARIYGNHLGLSKANARRVAVAVQEALGLSTSDVYSSGKGSDNPIASNNSAKGRALNRRIEVEFWHDDPLEDLPNEPQICPESAAAETVERIYNPPEGDIKAIYFENGQPQLPDGIKSSLQRAMEDLHDKGNVRLRFIGYTSNKRLDRRTAMVYGDDIGLSTARARRAMEIIKEQMNLGENQVEYEGHGYVQSHDVVNTGFVELDRSKVEIQVVYDELAILDENEGISIERINRDVETRNPYALNLMRISVDGQPINDPNKNTADVQRCTDVALDQAQIRFKFDNLQVKPRLNVTAWPNVINEYDRADTEFVENMTNFKLYTNYASFIDRAEVRLFYPEQSTRDTPIDILQLDEAGKGQWRYSLDNYVAPRMSLKYVLRVYDEQNNYDETAEQTLWIVSELAGDNSARDVEQEVLVGYGENRLAVNNITIKGGVVSVYGNEVPNDYQVWFAGHDLPVSDEGEFGGEFILPSGLHSVELMITDEFGSGHVYRRDLDMKKSDWFYVGMADITASQDDTSGPANLVARNETDYDNDFNIEGRLAIYAKGKLDNESILTISADTRESEIDELFSHFVNKTPEALFRRMDPDQHYPSFGDDSTLEVDAPTSGKFYIKWQKDDDYGMWGNFNIAYLDNSLAHVDRGLYGANVNYESNDFTSFGEERFAVNMFAAEPGTLAARDEFLSTSGSLYYLQHQDILTGSERIRIEIRDAVSGLVEEVKNLTYGLDYDIDYIQGRVMLTEPLAAKATSAMLVDSRDFGDNDVFLVARYEYTPGFDDLNDITSGGRMHYWFNDRVKLGLTAEEQEMGNNDASLNALDLTLRKSAGTWVKLERSRSDGSVSSSALSSDGGFGFNYSSLPVGSSEEADGQRVDASLQLEDISNNIKGIVTIYNQKLDAGYSAPGLLALTETTQQGGSLQLPVNDAVNVILKADSKNQDQGLDTDAVELNIDYQMDKHWNLGLGLRNDKRTDNSVMVPLTQQQGERTDATFKAGFDTKEDWLAYGYIQDTLDTTGNREENGRIGLGSEYRFNDRLKLDSELSDGDLGTALKLGSDYKMTDATNIYSSYSLADERSDNGVKARKGNLTSGFKSKYSDSASIYMEERYTHGDVPTGLTHSMGFDLAVNDRLNLGGDMDIGSLFNNSTGAETKRRAIGIRTGYKFDALTYAGAFELRNDETEQADASLNKRSTWLMKNNLSYRVSDDWRVIGKLNLSESDSSLGEFYDGNFTEAVIGYAFRPVNNDSLNALFKYTYLYNMPTTDQFTQNNLAAQYIQKSHVGSIDVMKDINRRWSLGGKYAYRVSELSLDRENPQFFDSRASLYILRADWHFTHHFDALVEARLLEVTEAKDKRSGFLAAIYHHFNSNIKAGIGYNFTDFSDDLTDLDYDSQGLFINAVGKF